MTKSEFVKEIIKEGNVIIELIECSSYFDMYKLMESYGPNVERIKAKLLYRWGNPCNSLTILNKNNIIKESVNYFNHYIVVEEY